jgi:GntR family transcriptional regulator
MRLSKAMAVIGEQSRKGAAEGRVDMKPPVGFRPLYLQVREELERNIAGGRWQQGAALPSEVDLARELRVSQGTIRKALDSLTADSVLVRRQGRGTFIAEFEESRIFHFFRLHPDGEGERIPPQSEIFGRSAGRATLRERAELDLNPASRVVRLERRRRLAGTTIIREEISLPLNLFPDLAELSEIPNNLYQFYSRRYGITITKSREKLKAVAAAEVDARHLDCHPGQPLLHVARTAFDVQRRPVEYRNSYCLTTHLHYVTDIS